MDKTVTFGKLKIHEIIGKLTTYIYVTGIDIVRLQTAFCYAENDS